MREGHLRKKVVPVKHEPEKAPVYCFIYSQLHTYRVHSLIVTMVTIAFWTKLLKDKKGTNTVSISIVAIVGVR